MSYRHLSRLLALVSAFLLIALVGPRAVAHSELLSSNPQNGATLGAMPNAVTLVFSDPIDPKFAQAVVADGQNVARPASPQVKGSTMSVPIPEGQPQGAVHVRYRVVSADGHPVSGEMAFTVNPSGSPASGASSSTAPPPSTVDAEDEAASNAWIYALSGFAALLVVAGGAAVLLAGRRRRH